MITKNPKFQFSESQALKILEAANHINKAADCLVEINGMLTSLLNAMSLDLIDQIGLSHELQEKLDSQSKPKITEAEIEEVNKLMDELGV